MRHGAWVGGKDKDEVKSLAAVALGSNLDSEFGERDANLREAVRRLGELGEVRRRVAATAERAGMEATEVADLVTATSELAANSVMHGGGSGTLRLWREDQRLLAEVEDGGQIKEPLVGRIRPGVDQEGGRGLWLANQLCDLVQIRSGETGTTVRLHLLAPEAAFV